MSAFDWGVLIGSSVCVCISVCLYLHRRRADKRWHEKMDKAERRAFGDAAKGRTA